MYEERWAPFHRGEPRMYCSSYLRCPMDKEPDVSLSDVHRGVSAHTTSSTSRARVWRHCSVCWHCSADVGPRLEFVGSSVSFFALSAARGDIGSTTLLTLLVFRQSEATIFDI